MKKITIIFLLLFSINGQAQECINTNNKAFGDNEFLKYKVYYNWKDVWLKAGSVSFNSESEYIENKPSYHLIAKGKTYSFYNWFFKVDDTYESYVSKKSVLPYKFIRDVHEGSFKLDHVYNFDRQTLKVHTKSKVNKHAEKIKNFDFNPCTHDMLSAIYYMRTIDFKTMKIGEEKPVEVFLDNEFYNLSMIYKGKAIVDTKYGKIRCLKVVPKVISGRVFKDEEAVTVYVSDDENKIPILIKSPLSVGSIKVILEDYDNLKNEMTSIE